MMTLSWYETSKRLLDWFVCRLCWWWMRIWPETPPDQFTPIQLHICSWLPVHCTSNLLLYLIELTVVHLKSPNNRSMFPSYHLQTPLNDKCISACFHPLCSAIPAVFMGDSRVPSFAFWWCSKSTHWWQYSATVVLASDWIIQRRE